MSRLLNMDETCELLGIARGTGWKLVREGRIPAIRVSERVVRIRQEDLDAYLAERTYTPDSAWQ